ncbi:hypothetical protein [Streptomyces fungicidicus]|uniref:hypothetical protein n=1 Tax=Streptomyces fungicidicus TaxID=68203 RepID=UPI00380B05C4
MAAEQLPNAVREFTDYLRGLLARLDRYGGWCLVFWQRDPDGMRACVEGREPPPWDVVESLLQDLATAYGPGAAGAETPGARSLHAAALTAYDARPGARDALGDRLDVLLRERRYAAERRAELTRRLASATTPEEADTLRDDLAWAHDDHARAAARCAEIDARLRALDRRAREPGRERWTARGGHGGPPAPEAGPGGGAFAAGVPGPGAATGARGGRRESASVAEAGPDGDRFGAGVPDPDDDGSAARVRGPGDGRDPWDGGGGRGRVAGSGGGPQEDSARVRGPGDGRDPWDGGGGPGPQGDAVRNTGAGRAAPAPGRRKRRRGGARFAGAADDEGGGPVVVPPAAVPGLPVAASASRGARFAGGAEAEEEPVPRPGRPVGAADRQEVGRVVAALARLRREARGGEAHALLTETAHSPADRFPLLADEMQRAGLGADWATLLWEAAASLPADRLVAAAGALTVAGRAQDGEQILRQGVVRPAEEIGRAVLTLTSGTRHQEARALLDACVRMRTPEDAARAAAPDPHRLVPLLLTAARGVSDERHWDLLHALRVAGFAA